LGRTRFSGFAAPDLGNFRGIRPFQNSSGTGAMKKGFPMTRLTLPLAAIAALIAVAPNAPAVAKDGAQNAITVTAPRVRREGRDSAGIPVQTVSIDALVDYSDLDLQTAAGRDQLQERVRAAAEDSCAWLDELYPLDDTTDPADCVRRAVGTASSQIDEAILDAG
jgi:UrcA family protein